LDAPVRGTYGADIAAAIESAFEWFQQHQVECSVGKELGRLVRSAYQQFELNLYEHFAIYLSPASKVLMDQSLDDVEGVVNFSDVQASGQQHYQAWLKSGLHKTHYCN
jgi:hypothetical protein